jgi:hypothetical protein
MAVLYYKRLNTQFNTFTTTESFDETAILSSI